MPEENMTSYRKKMTENDGSHALYHQNHDLNKTRDLLKNAELLEFCINSTCCGKSICELFIFGKGTEIGVKRPFTGRY